MSHSDVIEARPGRRARRVSVASVVTTLVLSIFATLLGPLGVLQSASAADGNPTFRIGTDDSAGYKRFIDRIRDRVNDGGSTDVVKAGGYRVHHTPSQVDLSSPNAYVRVDVQAWGNNAYVRLNLRRDNLYVVGWWDKHNTYHYLGARDGKEGKSGKPHEAESARWENGKWRKSKKQEQTHFGESYVDLERFTHRDRVGLGISRGNVNSAVWNLYNSSDDQQMAWGALVMAQFTSEAARLRGQLEDIGRVMGHGGGTFHIPAEFVYMQNNWGAFSSHFNALNATDHARHDGRVTRDSNPQVAYRNDIFGSPVRFTVETAFGFAIYVIATSKGRR